MRQKGSFCLITAQHTPKRPSCQSNDGKQHAVIKGLRRLNLSGWLGLIAVSQIWPLNDGYLRPPTLVSRALDGPLFMEPAGHRQAG